MDSPEDLVANQLCAVLGRSECKDLLDLYFFNEAGFDPIRFLDAAKMKDSGMEPAILAYTLQQLEIDTDNMILLKLAPPTELDRFRESLIDRLVRVACRVDKLINQFGLC